MCEHRKNDEGPGENRLVAKNERGVHLCRASCRGQLVAVTAERLSGVGLIGPWVGMKGAGPPLT